MLHREKHQLIMGRILRDIYNDVSIAPLLGFKGGTCAYFFYNLPRFSVDLDFDLFSQDQAATASKKIESILERYGTIKDSAIKYFTIFFLLSYGDADHNIKVEVNIRTQLANLKNYYEPKEYLGIPMLVGKKDYLFASKLAALTSRGTLVMRDIYDIWFFANNNWEINADIIQIRTGKKITEHLADCIGLIEQVKDNQILQGLGELLTEKEKAWVKLQLRQEVIFLLKNYQSVLK